MDILKVGTSAGGAKPKAIIAYNDTTGEVRSGQVQAPEGFGYWLLKFDGDTYSEHSEITDNPQGIGNIEYAYYLMAKDCGIDIMECRLLPEGDSHHFMTKRFDRTETNEKIHVQTLAGIAHYDRDQRHSYEKAFRVMRKMRLSKWTNRPQLSLNGKQENFTYEDLVSVAENMGIKNSKHIIAQIGEIISHWKDYVKEGGVREKHSQIINDNLLLLTPKAIFIQKSPIDGL